MKNLIEIALNNNDNTLNEDFNLSNNLLNMTKNLNLGAQRDIFDLPIDVEESSWVTLNDEYKTYIFKKYKLHSYKHLIYFLSEVIEKSEEIDHHPKLIIENLSITVELYTHTLNDVTENDIKLSKYIDNLYEDIDIISRM